MRDLLGKKGDVPNLLGKKRNQFQKYCTKKADGILLLITGLLYCVLKSTGGNTFLFFGAGVMALS
jgi:hypothetical protein